MLRYLIPILLTVSLLQSCKKAKEKSTQASKDYAMVQNNLSYVIPLVIHSIQSEDYLISRLRTSEDTLNSCAAYNYISGDTTDISLDPIKFSILYSQCYDLDNQLKNGGLTCSIDNFFDVDSAICDMSFDGFSINNNLLSGSFQIKRIDGNSFRIKTSNFEMNIGTKHILYSGEIIYNMGTGVEASLLYDNIITAEENGSLTDKFGNFYLVKTEEIIRDMNCSWFGLGIVEINNADEDAQVLDFGDGGCNNAAIITQGGEETTFSM